jgi:hypothetical protein
MVAIQRRKSDPKLPQARIILVFSPGKRRKSSPGVVALGTAFVLRAIIVPVAHGRFVLPAGVFGVAAIRLPSGVSCSPAFAN